MIVRQYRRLSCCSSLYGSSAFGLIRVSTIGNRDDCGPTPHSNQQRRQRFDRFLKGLISIHQAIYFFTMMFTLASSKFMSKQKLLQRQSLIDRGGTSI